MFASDSEINIILMADLNGTEAQLLVNLGHAVPGKYHLFIHYNVPEKQHVIAVY